MTDSRTFVTGYRNALVETLERLDVESVARAIAVLEQAWTHDRLVLLAGNGGSATTAEHMDLDLSKTVGRIAGPGRGFRTIALTHGAALSAWANDAGVESVYAGQVRDLGRLDDVLVAFSAKGNSPNIVAAVEEAAALGMKTIGFLGAGGGRVAPLVDVAVIVDSSEYGVIEDVHVAINHLITDYFGEWAGRAPGRVS
jgi:D-sedoheptulose 7-phosphate isomerase